MNSCFPFKESALRGEFTLDVLAKRVRANFLLSMSQLQDAAVELQVNLEMCRYEHGHKTEYPTDPYDEFVYFAALVCLDSFIPDDSTRGQLTHSQIYLACAWNYIAIARWLEDGRADSPERQAKEIFEAAQLFECAACRLTEDALVRSHRCLPCGIPKVDFPALRQ